MALGYKPQQASQIVSKVAVDGMSGPNLIDRYSVRILQTPAGRKSVFQQRPTEPLQCKVIGCDVVLTRTTAGFAA